MTFDWQSLVAGAVVLMAATYLVRRAWKTLVKKRAGGCGACGSCPAGTESATAKPLVQLGTFAKRRTKS